MSNSIDDEPQECDECGRTLEDCEKIRPACQCCGGHFCGECEDDHECENEECEP